MCSIVLPMRIKDGTFTTAIPLAEHVPRHLLTGPDSACTPDATRLAVMAEPCRCSAIPSGLFVVPFLQLLHP